LVGDALALGVRLRDELGLALGECVTVYALSVSLGLVPQGVPLMPPPRTPVPASAALNVLPETMQTTAAMPSALDTGCRILRAKAPPRSVSPHGPDGPCRP
jgi:hypothetical protein